MVASLIQITKYQANSCTSEKVCVKVQKERRSLTGQSWGGICYGGLK
jgi:hypothetical protein